MERRKRQCREGVKRREVHGGKEGKGKEIQKEEKGVAGTGREGK